MSKNANPSRSRRKNLSRNEKSNDAPNKNRLCRRLADTRDLKSLSGDRVRVRPPSAACKSPESFVNPNDSGLFLLCFAGDGRGAVVRQAKDIIGTGMVEAGKLDQYLGGDIPLAGLVIGVADLCAFQIRRNILLQQITILPQIPDTLIHGAYLKGFI